MGQVSRQNLHNLLGAIGEVFLNLLISELEDLKTICIGSLCCFGFSEVVNHSAVRERLLNIFICEEDDQIAIRIGLSAHSIGKDNFLLPGLVDSLDLAVMTHDLLNHLLILACLLVVFIRELE